MCNCLRECTKALRSKTGDPEASINSVFVVKTETGTRALTRLYPQIVARYRKRKQDGEFRKSQTTSSMIPDYCPWCGAKYER